MPRGTVSRETIGAVAVALLAGGAVPWWWSKLPGVADEADAAAKVVRIGTINSKHRAGDAEHEPIPDFVELVTSASHSFDVGSFQICEHDEGEEKDSCFTLPPSSMVRPGSPFRVYFFSPKDEDKRAMAAEFQARGLPVANEFGISAGELVVLYDANGDKLDQKKAR